MLLFQGLHIVWHEFHLINLYAVFFAAQSSYRYQIYKKKSPLTVAIVSLLTMFQLTPFSADHW